MGRRLRAKHRKTARDLATAYKADKSPNQHKIDRERTTRTRQKKTNRSY